MPLLLIAWLFSPITVLTSASVKPLFLMIAFANAFSASCNVIPVAALESFSFPCSSTSKLNSEEPLKLVDQKRLKDPQTRKRSDQTIRLERSAKHKNYEITFIT